MTAAGRLGLGVIGSGRVGTVLAAALAAAGHAVVGATAISEESRDRLDALLPGVPILNTPLVIERSELVLLAVPDDELPQLVAGLAEVRAWMPGQLVVHTAPGLGIGVLAPALAQGAIPLAIAPAMVFTGTSIDLVRLREVWAAVTAPAPVLPIGQALAVEMGAEPVVVAEQDRAAWGAALATAGALQDTIDAAVGILAGIGVDQPARVLGPLARSALERALSTAGAASSDSFEPPAGGSAWR
ncbi:DUF2520 domain-containing protein [uncultured Amnibacterium sp.]|uniref:DUF2520 domain-containing protein n=1 Tax=uncultured Amnibacterium sp. TaxID=1631851 RepID=UPI0035C97004